MAAQQIPRGSQDLRVGTHGIGHRASPNPERNRFFDRKWLFDRKSPAKLRDLRRNGPVRVQFSFPDPDFAGSRGMTASGPRHIPVLGRQAVEMLSPHDGGVYIDVTFGAGGYSSAILNVAGARVIGIDRDRSAIAGGFDLVDRSGG